MPESGTQTSGAKVGVRLDEGEEYYLGLCVRVRATTKAAVIREIGLNAAVAEGRRIEQVAAEFVGGRVTPTPEG